MSTAAIRYTYASSRSVQPQLTIFSSKIYSNLKSVQLLVELSKIWSIVICQSIECKSM